MEIAILTGMSGAGKTSAINICQDNDYYTIDNLPPSLISSCLTLINTEEENFNKFAFVVDIRVGDDLNDLVEVVEDLKSLGNKVRVIFLDASDSELIKRFQEKRRPHIYKDMPLENAILKERNDLKNIINIADYYIDTTDRKLASLEKELVDVLDLPRDEHIQIISFGFKYGSLKEADYIFDVRFIDNPFYKDELRSLSGLEDKVRDYVNSFEITGIFVDKVVDIIEFLVPNFEKSGKKHLVIGIGCTGGKHRSVVISELINERIKEKYNSTIFHREKNLW